MNFFIDGILVGFWFCSLIDYWKEGNMKKVRISAALLFVATMLSMLDFHTFGL